MAVTAPKLPPPPRSAQNRSVSDPAGDVAQRAVGGDDVDGADVVAGVSGPAAEQADTAAEEIADDADVRS